MSLSSINPHYTFEYSQPREYHFSHDSVFLARRVFEYCRDLAQKPTRGLDLCAGCGIIGLDFLFHCQKELQSGPAHFDFLEVQDIYREHFSENVARSLLTHTQLSFLNENYEQLLSVDFRHKYDLILCNPPYFHVGQGKLSPSDFKNRCRFFLDSDLQTLLRAIENSLSNQGSAFVLLRDQTEHGWSIQAEARKMLSPHFHIEILEDIRGTGLVRIYRQN